MQLFVRCVCRDPRDPRMPTAVFVRASVPVLVFYCSQTQAINSQAVEEQQCLVPPGNGPCALLNQAV